MLSMIANPVTALPVVYPRSGLSRSDLVLWPITAICAAVAEGRFRRKANSGRSSAPAHLSVRALIDVPVL